MTVRPAPAPSRLPSRPSSRRSPLPKLVLRGVPADLRILVLLLLLGFVVVMLIASSPAILPFTSLIIPLFLGSLLLSPRRMPWFLTSMLGLLAFAVSRQESWSARTAVALSVLVLMGGLVLVASKRRAILGVGAGRGESMFVDLCDRILSQGGIPDLPLGWHAESALRSAGGTPFAGDFLVATRPSPSRLEVAVVDVSGKGEQAGTRALLLSGAFGGLLGALPAAGFLPAANDYLVRQDWAEGFATAVHLSVDLATGHYEVRTAGHPPAVLRHAGSGRRSVLATEGPFLGLVPDAEFSGATGVIGPGDAIMLDADGMVEEPRLDIDLGIDRLIGEAEHLLRGSFHGSARRLVDAVGSRDDDRAMLVVTRA